MKSKIITITLLLIFFTFAFVFYLYTSVPTDKIKRLKGSYISIAIKKDDVDYSIISARPRDWVNLEQIDRQAVQAIIVSEDWFFYGHKGYDVNQIRDAFIDIIKGERFRGASTITQQVAKNIFLNSERSFWRKLKELFIAISLEKHLSKKRILEIYLNIIEYGKDLYGIKNASEYYFSKAPMDLNPKEGAFLAMLLPSPIRYAQSFEDKKLTPFAQKIIKSILKKMVKAKFLSENDRKYFEQISFDWEEVEYNEDEIEYNEYDYGYE